MLNNDPYLTNFSVNGEMFNPYQKIFISYGWSGKLAHIDQIKFKFGNNAGKQVTVLDWDSDGIATYRFNDWEEQDVLGQLSCLNPKREIEEF